jgi:hypothetical protein
MDLILLMLLFWSNGLSDTDTYEDARRAGERCARTPDMPNGHGIESCAGYSRSALLALNRIARGRRRMGYPGKAYRVFCSETGAGFCFALGGGWVVQRRRGAASADRWRR